MDPYQDLTVLRQMPALTWLRVHFNGIYATDYQQSLALAFPSSLLFLHVTCNVQRFAKGGSIYLRRLDEVGSSHMLSDCLSTSCLR